MNARQHKELIFDRERYIKLEDFIKNPDKY
jgi:hypothetical protein